MVATHAPATTSGTAITAMPHFIKGGSGRSATFNLVGNIAFSLTVGIGLGLVWKTYHWNEKRKLGTFYAELARKESEEETARKAAIQKKLKQLEKELSS